MVVLPSVGDPFFTEVMAGIREVAGENGYSILINETQFNTMTAKHYFCRTCGIYTHHQRRSNPQQYGFNVACLAGVDVAQIGDVPWGDGINHPNDR